VNVTEYTRGDVEGDWEFKIVRSNSAAFRKPEVLEKLIEEEAQAGWVMLEKFDDSRVRFKRRRSARARDDFLPEGVDPYRTRYGSSFRAGARMGALLGGVVALGMGILVFVTARGSDGSGDGPLWGTVAVLPAILVLLGLMIVMRRAR
jgi:hypothetical protein